MRRRAESRPAIRCVSIMTAAPACCAREVDGVVRQGVVSMPSVRWASMAPDRHSVNALTSERLTDKGGGPTFYSCLVQVEKSGD